MSRLPRPTTTDPYGERPNVLGPDTGLAQVLAFFESEGYSGPARAAWQAVTRTWNWAAPLTTAVPRTDVPGSVARPASGGFALSGRWRVPSYDRCDRCDGTAPWLALPLVPAKYGDPDLFVVPSKVLPAPVRARTDDDGGTTGPVFRLEDVYVPAGFVTHSTGRPLRAGDAPFFWTAVTGLALGAARRMTDLLAAPADTGSGRGPVPSPVSAELAAVLHDERLSLAAVLHGAPSARQGLPAAVEARLAAHVGRAGTAVHHVVAAAYEHTLTADWGGGPHPLVSLIEAGSPILQQARYATELLPPRDRTSLRKAEHGDDRRIPG
ncbi:hypothetical protein [Streptomyces sp. YU58]|uniref:hypothetical protein n=1 Tax=Streptomyces sp. SX92 TaxID=3158972 RepID=UPI0027BA0A36|nr:hypothetical protein [Streptomyces coralus]WLW58143.1 hypothetical protein QU709_45270 [Streptomyces coralus]